MLSLLNSMCIYYVGQSRFFGNQLTMILQISENDTDNYYLTILFIISFKMTAQNQSWHLTIMNSFTIELRIQ